MIATIPQHITQYHQTTLIVKNIRHDIDVTYLVSLKQIIYVHFWPKASLHSGTNKVRGGGEDLRFEGERD